MRRVGHVDQRGAVELGLAGQRVDRLFRLGNPTVMADIGDPAVALVMNDRLVGATPLQIAVADQRHVAGLGVLLRESATAGADDQPRQDDDGTIHSHPLSAAIPEMSSRRKPRPTLQHL